MFENLAGKLQETFRKLAGKGRLTEKDVDESLREVRLALLDADVHFKVVKSFIANVRDAAVGSNILSSLAPSHQVIKIVYDELVKLLGGSRQEIATPTHYPLVIMLVGLQGSGKTTLSGKMAIWVKDKRKMNAVLVGADPYRPAANLQLQTLAEQVGAGFVPSDPSPLPSVQRALAEARSRGTECMIVDTAGRLQTDDDLMKELASLKEILSPHEILLVADATTGQESVSVARSFHSALKLTGIVLTKMDGDARGGAALSMMSEIGVPVKMIGVGEKLNQLEPFHPDRMASRILGMGDVLTLIDKAQETVEIEEAQELEEKLRKMDLDLGDLLSQVRRMKKMGGLREVLNLIPGMSSKMMGSVNEGEMKRIEAILLSMTPAERRNPRIIDGSRRRRIAKGSGTHVSDVARLLQDFKKMKKMMRGMKGRRRLQGLGLPMG